MRFCVDRRSLGFLFGAALLGVFLTLSSTAALAQAVVINEIHYDQASGEQEFIELYAATGPVDMTGWTLADQDEMTYVIGRPANPSFPCTGTFTLNAGDRVVFWQGAGTSVCTGTTRQIFMNRGTFLQKEGDDVVLRDGGNVCRDFVAFETGVKVNAAPAGCSWGLPSPTNGNVVGRSVSRFDSPLTDTDQGSDWEASGTTTTTGPKSPGAVNVNTPVITCTTNQDCADANPCTDDVCTNPGTFQSACTHPSNTAACDDNNACTGPDACSNGTCGGPSLCAPAVHLNEVHYDQASGEQEFVELYVTSGPVDMTGWKIEDQDEATYVIGRPANPSFPCTGTFTLNAGDRVVLWQGAGTSVCTGTTRQIFMNRGTFLQKDGDDVVLRSGDTVCRDYVAFETGVKVNPVPAGCSWTGPNPGNGDIAGRSVSRFDVPFTDTDSGADWERSGQTSTTGPKSPGAVNVTAPVITCTTNQDCADANPCTDDTCQDPGTPQSTCSHINNTAPCNDNNVCTNGETCSNGACAGGTVVCVCQANADCADTNPCTDDVCLNPGTPQAVCGHPSNTASCSDGNACTGPDTCSGGACTGGPNICVGGVFLNEVHYDQASGEQEFVELYATGGPIDMTGWKIEDQDEATYVIGRPANPSFPCTGTFTLDAGDRVVLWQGSGTSVCTGTTRQIFMNRGTFLQKEGDDVVLRAGDNTCRDYVAFETGVKVNPPPAGCSWTGPNPTNGDTAGRSVSRFDGPFTDTDSGADWERSGLTITIGPKTPGARNVAAAFCGDGVVNQGGEQCDDGNQNNNDACSNNCTQGCGNGIVNTGEPCDDGNLNDNDTCSNNCTSGCGNGIVNTGEACDDGNADTNDACSNNCTQGCGNGIVNTGEQCDDGNQVDFDACTNACLLNAIFCGDGVVNQPGEQCDDGNQNNNDACSNDCTQGCGNGIVNTGEQCDDGNANNNDACSNNCTGGCGNGIVNTGEACDDGNPDNNDACSNNCTQGCGNGILNTGEACDDGNGNNNDACSNNCTNGCGNGILNTGEACDDGNGNNNDACSNNCTQGCGNGILNTGEACDDGNGNNNDACSNNCTQGCGNGIVNTGEACDDGNANNNDACSNNCTQGCGNGIVNTGEQCDDGNADNNDVCSNNCTGGCGNGIVNTGEQCDDGNQVDDDTCTNACTVPSGNVLLAEVQYDQASGAQEFIEMLAIGAAVDISGWKLTDNDAPGPNAFSMIFAASDAQFPCTTPFVLNAGDRLVVYQGAGTNVCTGTSRAIYLNRTVFLPASGDDLGLFDAALACKDYVAFGTGGALPAGCAFTGTNPSNGGIDGTSISRFDQPPVVDHDTASDWEASGTTTGTAGPMTPGQQNFVSVVDTDGDGVPDSTDNCPTTANAGQQDSNANGIGNACEAAGGSVLINEVHYDQGAGQEFIELLARTAPVAFTSWKLTDNDAPGATAFSMTFDGTDAQFPCPTPFALFPGDRLVIYTGAGANVCGGSSRAIYLNRSVFLPAGGDDLGLFDAGAVCKDYVAFEAGGALPAGCAWSGANPSNGGNAGTSMSRKNNPVVDTDAGADWVASGTSGTIGPSSPGQLNN